MKYHRFKLNFFFIGCKGRSASIRGGSSASSCSC